MAASKNSRNLLRSDAAATALCAVVCTAIMACAAWHFYTTGVTLWYGDAEAHLNIARRVVDTREPGLSRFGTTWLPLPHLLMVPFVKNDEWWRNSLAGVFPSAVAMALAGTFLFAGIRRAFESVIAGAAAAAVFLLNPNTLYLGSIPMSEASFFASFFALLYFTVRFEKTKGWGALIGAGIAACATAMARYEGWFLIPFVAIFLLVTGRGLIRRFGGTITFCFLASVGPVAWMIYNRFYFGDALFFYRGPWSAAAIQGNQPYPGLGDWHIALQYFLEAGKLLIGWPGLLLGTAGAIVALLRRSVWPVILTALLPAFYLWSIHSSSTPIFVPTLWPHSFYNTRYAMALLPMVAVGTGALARFGRIPAAVAVLIAFTPVLLQFNEHSITWQESDVNSRARREWNRQTADWLRGAMGPNETVLTTTSDVTATYRLIGLPLHRTLTGDDDLEYLMALANPQVFLHTDWAVVLSGSDAQSMLDRARRYGPKYELRHIIMVKGEPALEIYKREPDVPEIPDDTASAQ
jgi:hypothetical protein